MSATPNTCAACLTTAKPVEISSIRCNVRKFRDQQFRVWRCAHCRSLHCDRPDNLETYYNGYPIRNQRLDYFTRSWYRVVLKRLRECGVTERDRILDYGCNNGLLIDYLKERGFKHCVGFDPYVDRFNDAAILTRKYTCIISLDVIEHDEDPRAFLNRLSAYLEPNGRICIETPNAEGIKLTEPEEFLHALHAPYHLHILSSTALQQIGREAGLQEIAIYKRWYMDSWQPGTARRLFETLMTFSGNDIDSGYESPNLNLFFKHPILFVYLFFGFFFSAKKQDHMMMIMLRPPVTHSI